jgi:hypothetical protein
LNKGCGGFIHKNIIVLEPRGRDTAQERR